MQPMTDRLGRRCADQADNVAQIDYYDILDIRPSAGPEEIRAAYHRAARSVHPDAGGTADMFRLVAEAYRTLSDPHLRAAYDARADLDSTMASRGGFGATSAERDEAPAGSTPPEEFADPGFSRLDRWMVGGAGRTVVRWATVVAVAIFAAITYILVEHHTLVRPEAAGEDAWGDLLANTSVLRIVLIAYAVVALGAYVGLLRIPLAIIHGTTFLGVVVWFVVYWGLASRTERLGFIAVIGLWSIYAAVMAVVPLLRESRLAADSGAE
ncbi:J domain-containing protein [Jiangella mangrovi]|uniref:J domain-containing protein n=1 Tax=Jiangella mangrovi TaxID=1524084 RepID=A0A7W9GP52_9ACTN|nr:J domain-containing protein [Jiangella mangrovi]MBB5787186.1 hypothetical protein [Jiangella mangrovi]